MSRTPPLSNNRFSILPVDNIPEIDESVEPKVVPIPEPISATRRPRWERIHCSRFIINALDEINDARRSLTLKIELQTTDTGETKSVKALLDSGATGMFIDKDYVKENNFDTRKLSRPIPLRNVDGTPNEAGSVTEVVGLILRYKNHSEKAYFAVASLGNQKVIMGHTWLQKHNPDINWVTGDVSMSRCSGTCCSGCQEEIREERRQRKLIARRISTCSEGDVPQLLSDDEEDDELNPESEDGDRIFVTAIGPLAEEIRATSTISQRLAESFKLKSESNPTLEETIGDAEAFPDRFREFSSVFSKESFDSLPDSRPWDHAIELIPGEKPSGCKVYPLSPTEQKELDAFLKENLETGRIRPSKSPMASPVFFIKKKDGSLRLVQDYRALNGITIKNKYPLPLISELIETLRGARYFTKLDVRWGFNNVRIKDGDEWKAAFRTNRGLFEPLVMFFGLTNSPATFQTMMNDIFQRTRRRRNGCGVLG